MYIDWQEELNFIKRLKPKKMKTGIELIAAERNEQINKHGRTLEKDIETNSDNQLLVAAHDLICGPKPSDLPKGWDKKVWEKMAAKNYTDRLITAGALIAAELDRVNELRRRRDEKKQSSNSERLNKIDEAFAKSIEKDVRMLCEMFGRPYESVKPMVDEAIAKAKESSAKRMELMANGLKNAKGTEQLFESLFGMSVGRRENANAEGHWYKTPDGDILFIAETAGPFAKGYGFTTEGFGQVMCGVNPRCEPTRATPEEVKDAYLAQARKMGYHGGVKIKSLLFVDGSAEINSQIAPYFHPVQDGIFNVLYVGGACVHKNGRWAEIIK